MGVKLKVFYGESFQATEIEFNQWMSDKAPAQIANISFHNGESKREITVLYTDKVPERPNISVPAIAFPQRRN